MLRFSLLNCCVAFCLALLCLALTSFAWHCVAVLCFAWRRASSPASLCSWVPAVLRSTVLRRDCLCLAVHCSVRCGLICFDLLCFALLACPTPVPSTVGYQTWHRARNGRPGTRGTPKHGTKHAARGALLGETHCPACWSGEQVATLLGKALSWNCKTHCVCRSKG